MLLGASLRSFERLKEEDIWLVGVGRRCCARSLLMLVEERGLWYTKWGSSSASVAEVDECGRGCCLLRWTNAAALEAMEAAVENGFCMKKVELTVAFLAARISLLVQQMCKA
ncbi:hypothetical protein ZIOFF_018471 [Zingiber officinale]|uniref:Uncharacterized protein n=1 Tax=Zingiber officinale TaxID=94328 RepID=A0A8J5LQX3_ZINOF|nr:hypothetical protein ZIOFF_018471 [Zingiber officinale]